MLGQLKKHPDTRHVPVAIIGDPGGRIAALRAGAATFLDDPVNEAELERALADLERLTEMPERRIALIVASGQSRYAVPTCTAMAPRARAALTPLASAMPDTLRNQFETASRQTCAATNILDAARVNIAAIAWLTAPSAL